MTGARRAQFAAHRAARVACVVVLALAGRSVASGSWRAVPGGDDQPSGPVHSYRIGETPVTNAEFAAFLTDAVANLNNERGAYLYFDTDSSDVFIHSAATGQLGTTGSGTHVLDASVGGALSYDSQSQSYVVAAGREEHPVVGVTWYGAVKYCNWLTLDAGWLPAQRAYHEGTNSQLSEWRPVPITAGEWAGRDLNDTERLALLDVLGYRLPMDDQADTASLYNEWYKAAAWDDSAGYNYIYGFGADSITGPDANYRNSGDPFDNGTTPVGYYDGSDHGGAYATNDGTNYYGLYDCSGNVWEWMQDQGALPGDRRNRGGSYNSSALSLRVDLGPTRAASAVDATTGFRVAQAIVDDVQVLPEADLVNAGPWGGPYDEADVEQTYSVENVVLGAVDYMASVDVDWLELTGDVAGTLDEGESAAFTVAFAPACDDGLVVGENVGTVTVDYGPGVGTIERTVRLTVREPVSLLPASGYTATLLYGDVAADPADATYSLQSSSDLPVEWSVAVEYLTPVGGPEDWLLVEGGLPPALGVVPALGATDVELAVDPDADPQGPLDLGSYTAEVTFSDTCTGSTWQRAVALDVLPWFLVSPSDVVTATGPAGGPFAPLAHEFDLSNLAGQGLDWLLAFDPSPAPIWLDLDTQGGYMGTGGQTVVTATVNDLAWEVEPTSFPEQVDVALQFEHDRVPATGFVVERTLQLEIVDWATPESLASFTRSVGEAFEPTSAELTLVGNGFGERAFTASADETWLDVTPAFGLVLGTTGITEVTVTPNAEAYQLAPGVHTALVTLADVTYGPDRFVTTREVTVVVQADAFAVPMEQVPVETGDPTPAYGYRIGRYEVTQAEFARFLNDALANPAGPRGEYLYFDPAGDVYLDDQQTPVFTLADNPHVSLDSGRYVVASGFAEHPATGMSWYGAVKFCNWMSVVQGMTDGRAYTEGPGPGDWGPVASGGSLIALRGFRLPSDDGATTVSPYNEWYKAAAWQPGTSSYSDYGFGADVITVADANFYNSLDPFADTTPAGYYDGVNVLQGGGATADTRNAYGLYDLTGNVAEWVHDAGAQAGEHAVRGGHHDNAISSPRLRTDVRASFPTGGTYDYIGLRVLQALPDPLTAWALTPVEPVTIDTYAGGPLPETVDLVLDNPGDYTLDTLAVSVSGTWLELTGSAALQVPPAGQGDVELAPSASAGELGVSPLPTWSGALIRADDPQPGGPTHDLWVAQYEVSNARFAAFLNDAYDDAQGGSPSERSAYLYFHTDSGSVYINTAETAAVGTAGGTAPLNVPIYDAGVGRIGFAAGAFTVETGYEQHPVVGVSWYGACKYCNWLSLDQGLPAALRAYAEAPASDLAGWHPVVVDTAVWSGGGLTPADRAQLVDDVRSYRLPMDEDGAGPSDYNEWYALSAWEPATATNHRFGTGRDADLVGADANFACSGDPQEDEDDCTVGGTTSVGYYDGVNLLADGETATRDTDHPHGLYDLCGNVAEWVQGGSWGQQAVRGGSWRDVAGGAALETATRTVLPPATVTDAVGFRVVRRLGRVASVTVDEALTEASATRHLVLHLQEPVRVTPANHLALPVSILYGQDLTDPPWAQNYTVTNRSATEMDYTVSVDQTWVDLTPIGGGDLAGTLAANGETGDSVEVEVAIGADANALGPGDYAAAVSFRNDTTAVVATRAVAFTIDWPIGVIPPVDPAAFTGILGGPFANPNACTYTLVSYVDFNLQYEVSADQDWVTIDDTSYPLSGTLSPGDARTFDVSVNAAADSLSVGTYTAELSFRFTDLGNGNLSDALTETVSLTVADPIAIATAGLAPDEPWPVGPELDPLPSRAYELTNRDTSASIDVLVAVDVDWLDVSDATVAVLPGATEPVSVSVNAEAFELYDGGYEATISFTDSFTGHEQTRSVTLTISEHLAVAPKIGLEAFGQAGGPIAPAARAFVVTNLADDTQLAIDWLVTATPPVDWLLLNGQATPLLAGMLADGEATFVQVAIDEAQTAGLAAGPYETTLEFVGYAGGSEVARTSRTVQLTLVTPLLDVLAEAVPSSAAQPGGPAYNFTMGRYPVTNTEFAAFLNDTLTTSDADRSAYMFFDTSTGDVYVNSSVTRETGTDPGSRLWKMFAPASAGRIAYEAGSGLYGVASGFGDHPVAGVSWYGALKYCNWLTLDQGFGPDQRCYNEDTDANLSNWRPQAITQANWQTRDLTDAERLALVTGCRGYRLPMDDGAGNPTPSEDFADAYNEWYKAAAWSVSLGQNVLFGFGRNTCGGSDANYYNSGDPFDNGTTPVGYYDGSDHGGAFVTAANDNSFGLYDLSGNTYEWLQGRYSAGSFAFRTVRGGCYSTHQPPTGGESIYTATRNFGQPGWTNALIGFRVLRADSTLAGDQDGDGDLDLADARDLLYCLVGPDETAPAGCTAFDEDDDGDVDMTDVAAFAASFTGAGD